MIDAMVTVKEFDLRIEVVNGLVMIFPGPSEKRALIFTADECVDLAKKLLEVAKQIREGEEGEE